MREYISVPVIFKSLDDKTDEDGNYIFEVEASNENLDLQGQQTQQKALLKSKSFFLSNGVISDDHQHRTVDQYGNSAVNNEKIIGEPLDVWTEGNRTFVKGKLYANVAAAKPFIDMLKAHSTRVKASIGGFQPEIIKNKDGTETITSFLWNDLALTCSPVNSTVAPARFAKSMSNEDFCKSLCASGCLDSTEKVGGNALIPEDLEKPTVNVLSEKARISTDNAISKADYLNDVATQAFEAIDNGDIGTKNELKTFLADRGIESKDVEDIADYIMKENENMSVFTDRMNTIFKSMTKKSGVGKAKKDEDLVNVEDENLEEDLPEFDFDDEDDDDDDNKVKKAVKKSLYDNDDVVDLMNSLKDDIKARDNEIEELRKSIIQMGEIMQKKFSTPQLRKSIMSDNGRVDTFERPTEDDKRIFIEALCDAKRNGRINLMKSVRLETVFNKSMAGIKPSTVEKAEMDKIYNDYMKGGRE